MNANLLNTYIVPVTIISAIFIVICFIFALICVDSRVNKGKCVKTLIKLLNIQDFLNKKIAVFRKKATRLPNRQLYQPIGDDLYDV